MAIDMRMVRSRRSLLTAALAGMAGAAAATMAGAQRVLAAGDDGTSVAVAGGYTDARHTTVISNQSNDQTVFQASSLFHGGTAVRAYSDSGIGVLANSDEDYGVFGYTNAGEGVFGRATSGTGIHGVVGLPSNGTPPLPRRRARRSQAGAGVSILAEQLRDQGHRRGRPRAPATVPPGQPRSVGRVTEGQASAGSPVCPVPQSATQDWRLQGREVGVSLPPVARRGRVPSPGGDPSEQRPGWDLFLDKSHRLWLCKGDTIWAKLG